MSKRKRLVRITVTDFNHIDRQKYYHLTYDLSKADSDYIQKLKDEMQEEVEEFLLKLLSNHLSKAIEGGKKDE